jgi:threonylcarbamoyladenosine tRNA methylthiotransferase MtaB
VRVRLESIGCRLNIGEIQAMARGLAAGGHTIVGPGDGADLCVINTCTVTAVASKKSRQLIRQLKRANPAAKIVVTGCEAELAPHEISAAGVDLLVGNADKDRLLEVISNAGLLIEATVDPDQASPIAPGISSRTRAFLKVQDGCDNRCAFCVITVARGAGHSLSADSVLEEVHELCRMGFQELVLSGVHLGSYGHDLGDLQGLRNLVERILAESEVPRLRLSSVEPWDLDPGFFEIFSDPRLLPHLHLPLQSGCNATLKRMARRTSRAEYSRLVEEARAVSADISVSTDLIVGFPGEDDDEFNESLDFVEEQAFSRLHIFRFSPREGTPAASMPDQVSPTVAQDRSRRLHALGADLEAKFASRFQGRTLEVLWESCENLDSSLRWSGLTPNYIRVVTESGPGEDLTNLVIPTTIVDTCAGGLVGRLERSSKT